MNSVLLISMVISAVGVFVLPRLLRRPLTIFECLLIGSLIGSLAHIKGNCETVEPKYKIAIIDTGYTGTKLKLCKTGHYDFMTNKPMVGFQTDQNIPHGQYVGDIIAEGLKDVDYCAIIFQMKDDEGFNRISNYVSALLRIYTYKVTAVNISLNGPGTSILEREALKLVAEKARVFVAAGNDHQNLDFECDAFPTCYKIPNVYPIGALAKDGTKARLSNRGSVIKEWYPGNYKDEFGTSFATPRALVNYVRSLSSAQLVK